jgi:hypothetical protein
LTSDFLRRLDLKDVHTVRAGWLFFESPSRSIFLFEHDLFEKPVPTFPDHAQAPVRRSCTIATS